MNALDPVMRVSDQIAEAIRLHEPTIDRKGVDDRIAELFGYVGISAGAGAPVPARVLRRHAPARDDRARPGLQAGADHRRRADHRARRDDAGADPGAARGAAPRARPGDDPDHARPVGARGDLRPGRDHVRGPDRRDRRRCATCTPRRSTRTRSGCWARSRPSAARASSRPPSPACRPTPCEQPPGCRFAPRCHRVAERCGSEEPELRPLSAERLVRCHYAPWPAGGDGMSVATCTPASRCATSRCTSRSAAPAAASCAPSTASTSSGGAARCSGSSASRAAASRPSAAPCSACSRPRPGEILVDGAPLANADLRAVRRRVQMIFQDPYQSLNPRQTVGVARHGAARDPRHRPRRERVAARRRGARERRAGTGRAVLGPLSARALRRPAPARRDRRRDGARARRR